MAAPLDLETLTLPERIEIDADLVLRALTEEDAPGLFAAVDRAREPLGRILPWVHATHSPEDSLAFIRSHGRLARALVVDGEIAGCLGINALDPRTGRVEFGYWLEPRAQGRGAMTRACRALFRAGGFQELELFIPVGNEPSLAVGRRLGLTETGETVERHRHTLHVLRGVPV